MRRFENGARSFGAVLLLGISSSCAVSQHDPDIRRAPAKPTASHRPQQVAPAKTDVAHVDAGVGGATAVPAAPATAVSAVTPSGPRVYAKTRFVWIRPEPNAATEWIGFLWTGGSVKLKSETPISGRGCMTWYAVEPQGYVCVDGTRATLNAKDPVYLAIKPYAPNTDSPWVHHYAESSGLERLDFLAESPLGLPELPRTIREARRRLRRGSTVAYSTEFPIGDKQWLLSADFAYLPKERIKPYPKVTFRGIELGKDASLPLALFRYSERPKYKRTSEGAFQPTQELFERLSFVALSGEAVESEGERYLKLRNEDSYVKAKDAVVPTPREQTPWGAFVNREDTTGNAPKGRGTWLEVDIDAGWLTAYEGTRPVFTTLVSPGRGGPAKAGEDPLETAATPLGSFPISGKFITATMVAPGELVHSDVPWAQNFSGPHALHGAYWHNDWGRWKSGGCVNVSPLDGKWLFEFTEPTAPPGWHGTRWLPWQGPATVMIVHR